MCVYNNQTIVAVRVVVCQATMRALLCFVAATFAVVFADKSSEFVKGKICIGTNGRMSVPSNREHHYRNLRERYTNCTYVDGNLELTWLQAEHLDLGFLQYIREVTGYVLISHVDVQRVVLPKLQIIRGRTLFKINVHEEEFALMITLSKMHTLEMPALRDILSGSVGELNNYNLCHVKTIKWDEIITGYNSTFVQAYNFTSPERPCPPCDTKCEHGCWGEGPENCQKFSKMYCSPQCYQGRCFGTRPRECCHLFCAGGCTGPKQSDCLACRNFYDNGVCTQECPAMQRYNPITYSWESNPNGKYAYGATCVKKCPDHLLKDNGACVRSCPLQKKALNGECVNCDGPCPRKCKMLEGELSMHSGNIDRFRNCTIIEGSVSILDGSFKGFQQVFSNYTFGERYGQMHPDRLEVFSTLKEITGFFHIDGSHEDFTNLSYFRNLEIIGGRQLTDYFSSLYIVKSTLKSLGLYSLKKINSGSIAILENEDLCFAQGINWTRIKKSSEHGVLLQKNKNEELCKAEGLVCDEECSLDGCWGPGPDQCLSCAHFQLGNRCLQNCSVRPRIYKADVNLCKPCHEECNSTCHGPGPGNCTQCKNIRDGPFCTSKCPTSKYADESRECKPCHQNCVDGCTGPNNTVGPGGCNSCDKAIINGDVTVESCLFKNESCPDGFYYEWVVPEEEGESRPVASNSICRRCHPRCKMCTGYGFHEQVCQECQGYKSGEQCEDECPLDHYADESHQECVPCADECRGCHGPLISDCKSCRNYKIFPDVQPARTCAVMSDLQAITALIQELRTEVAEVRAAQGTTAPATTTTVAKQPPEGVTWSSLRPKFTGGFEVPSDAEVLRLAAELQAKRVGIQGRDAHDVDTVLCFLSEWTQLSPVSQKYAYNRANLLLAAVTRGWSFAIQLDTALRVPENFQFTTPQVRPKAQPYKPVRGAATLGRPGRGKRR